MTKPNLTLTTQDGHGLQIGDVITFSGVLPWHKRVWFRLLELLRIRKGLQCFVVTGVSSSVLEIEENK